jgi:carboxylate-amine ligase
MEVPERDLIEEYLAFVDDVVDELGSRDEVEYIRTIMKMGTGADRQLQVYHDTGDMKAVMDYIIEETEVGVGRDEDDEVQMPEARAV